MSEPAPRRFTLHVDYLATDEHRALNQAEAYVEALNLLRLEVDSYTARVSPDGNWSVSIPVYCGAPGPDPTDVCTDRAAHPGPHSGPGVTGRWSDDEIPQVPDTIGDMTSRFDWSGDGSPGSPDENTAPEGPGSDDPSDKTRHRLTGPDHQPPQQDPPAC